MRTVTRGKRATHEERASERETAVYFCGEGSGTEGRAKGAKESSETE